MPSPFPGMNPYFEQPDIWQDFHTEFLSTLRRMLVPQLDRDYFVQLEEYLYIHDLPPDPRRLVGKADLSIAMPGRSTVGEQATVALEEAPATLQLPDQDIERVRRLEIRDRKGRDLVTVIEMLSPSNKKTGDDRDLYLAKRRELLRSPAHLVEIDLLRGGPPMPPTDRPRCDYSLLISRAERRPAVDFWPIRLRERLPTVPIPLRPAVPGPRIDFQEVLHRAYDDPGYERFLYAGSLQPPLAPEDAEWARSLVPEGFTGGK